MAAERKVTADELARLRHLADDGWLHQDLADAFGITPQHVGRLVRGVQRPVIAGLDAEALRDGGAASAVAQFLEGVDLKPGDVVFAAMARSLGAKMDACSTSESASAAQALPRLSSQLVEVLDRLRATIPREPDRIDLIARRRQARLLASAAKNGNAHSTLTDGRHADDKNES